MEVAGTDEVEPTDADVVDSPVPPALVSLSTGNSVGSPLRGHPVGVPGLPGIRLRQDLQRALRPLRRRAPSRYEYVLDEDATATLIANTGMWAPVLRPAQERWFDVVLVVDTSGSMDLWSPVVKDLQSIFVRSGAFRDVRVWYLSHNEDGATVTTKAGASHRSPRELVDSSGRRLFFVLTDGAASGWHDGSATETLAEWGRTAPVAVLQPLPEEMWARTGLPTTAARLSAYAPGSPNSQLRVTYRRRRRTADVPIAVMGIEPFALRTWALLTAGAALEAPLATTTVTAGRLKASAVSPLRGDALAIQQFRAKASPEAYRLAVCLSVVPLTIQIMRWVQHAVLPSSSAVTLAEVMLGGLIVRTGDDSYDFLPGIRDALLKELRRSEASSVLSTVSQHISQEAGTTVRTFPAIAESVGGPVDTIGEPFSWVPAEVAVRLGLTSTVIPVGGSVGPPDATGSDLSQRSAPETGHTDAVRTISSRRLLNQQPRLNALVSFCLAPESAQGQYLWVRGPAGSGKSALLSSFALSPPAGVSVVSYFIGAIGRDKAEFHSVLSSQLSEVLGHPIRVGRRSSDAKGDLSGLLKEAALHCRRRGGRLVLIVDGLDDISGDAINLSAHGLGAMLPMDPPSGMRIVVSSRANKLPHLSLPERHPLRVDSVRVQKFTLWPEQKHGQGESTESGKQVANTLALSIETGDAAHPDDRGRSTNRDRPELGDLGRLALGGDRAALDELLTRVRPVARRYVRSRLWTYPGGADLVDDVTQEVCLAVLGTLNRYRDEGRPFEAFVYGHAARKVADAQRAFAVADISTPMVPELQDSAATPEEHAARYSEARQVAELVERLPEQMREILRMRVVAGLSAEETGSALGITPGAVLVAQHRALNTMRGIVDKDGQVIPGQ